MAQNNLFTNELVASSRMIYTPSTFAGANLLYLQEAGELKALAQHISGRQNLNSYLFYIVRSGSGTVSGSGAECPITKGNCVFIDCNAGYTQWPNADDLWELKWVHFNGITMPNIYKKYLSRGGQLTFKPSNLALFEEVLDDIYKTAESDSSVRDMRINEQLAKLLTLIMQQSRQAEENREEDTTHTKRDVTEIRAYIEEHYQESMTLETIAQRFYISKNYLARLFRKQCGMTINGYIQQVRVTQAKRLLRFTEKTMEEIAEECGFNDKNYFSRVFRKLESCSAGEYRKQWR